MIDLHSHILPGLDDGTRTLEEALEMAAAMLADGVTMLAATPHVRDDFPTTPEAMVQTLAGLRTALEAAGLPLEILPGGEIAYGRLDALGGGDLVRFGLGGNPRLVLLELPAYGYPLDLVARVGALREDGFTVVIAHPERHAELTGSPQRLHELAGLGTLFQVTAAALDGRLGRGQRSAGLGLVEAGFAHMIASDAHRPGVRAAGMRGAVEALADEAIARWLTVEVPQALLAGAPLPPRPARRGHWPRLRRRRH